MIDSDKKDVINKIGWTLSQSLGTFYGKITFNFHDGVYVSSNVEESIKPDNLKKGKY